MTTIDQWAKHWHIAPDALADLKGRMGLLPPLALDRSATPASEAAQQAKVRLEGASKGVILWRNNVGALMDERGIPVRYGLANESPQQNKMIKSADLIGIRKLLITSAHVGTTVGQFVSREMKEQGWYYTGKGREAAQQKWVELVTAWGGDAAFASGPGTL